jgi:hypothetical protein
MGAVSVSVNPAILPNIRAAIQSGDVFLDSPGQRGASSAIAAEDTTSTLVGLGQLEIML